MHLLIQSAFKGKAKTYMFRALPREKAAKHSVLYARLECMLIPTFEHCFKHSAADKRLKRLPRTDTTYNALNA
eukprot:1137807-Pelagomonas_calceolata.AAC.11